MIAKCAFKADRSQSQARHSQVHTERYNCLAYYSNFRFEYHGCHWYEDPSRNHQDQALGRCFIRAFDHTQMSSLFAIIEDTAG
jgi:hypothetical protein